MPNLDAGGATDMGDVSHRVPAIHPWIGMDCPDLTLHTKEFAEVTMQSAGDRAIELGAKAMALTGLDILTDSKLLEQIKAEFEEARKDF